MSDVIIPNGEPLLKPMSTAPRKAILAVHFEKGPMEIRPDHEANWWLAYKQPGVGHWFNVDDEEGGSMDDGEFDGWIAESMDDGEFDGWIAESAE